MKIFREREKKRSLCFYALSGIHLNSFLLCALNISIFTIYCRAIDGITKQLCTVVFFTMHCSLYNVCNNHIDGQSDTVPNNCLKQSKTKSTMLIAFCSYLLIVLFGFFFFLTLQVYWKMSIQMLLIGLCVVLELRNPQTPPKAGTWDLIYEVQCSLPFCFSKDWGFYDSSGQSQTLILGLNSNNQFGIYFCLRKEFLLRKQYLDLQLSFFLSF